MSSCNNLLQQIKNIKEIILPFHYELVGSENYIKIQHELPMEFDSVDFSALRGSNYTPYQLKCFLSKLSSELNRLISGEWYLSIIPKRLGDKMVLCLETYVDGEYYSPNETEIILINKLIKKYNTDYVDYVSIIDDSSDIKYKDIKMQKHFINQMLPYIQLPDYDYIYEEGKLMVRFYTSTYTTFINELYIWILDLFVSLYEKGVILLDSSNKDKSFAKRWLLQPLYEKNIYESQYQPYIPSWDNRLLSSQMTEFIQRCYHLGDMAYISLPIKGEAEKVSISTNLDKIRLKHQYVEKIVFVNVNSYAEAEAALEIIIQK